MNRIELKEKLDKLGIHQRRYSLYGVQIPDCIVMEWHFKWEIFYFDERGNINKIASLNSEDEACEYFYNMMLKDKQIDEKIKNMPPYIPQKKEKRTFIVSNSGETKVENEK
jgi:S-adenosylmethionine hydrolase